MDASSPPTRSGDVIGGKYRLLERLGVGGMGEVYRATNETIGRIVAIKLLRPEHASSPETSERLAREARAANLVRHVNVVDVLDHGVDERLGVFLVQELLEGVDLSDHLKAHGGRLPPAETFGIFGPIVDAVAAAHASGVVHRDLKPGNIYLARQPDGRVVPKVLDFGISKITGLTGRIDVSTMSVTMGTPAYMSPEQIQGEPVDARSDVWSLGVILHQMISGELPFRGDSPGKQYVKICTEPPVPLDEAAPGAPPAIVALVARCLQKEAGDRFQNAGELAAALREIAVGELAAVLPAAAWNTQKVAAVGEIRSNQSLTPVSRRSMGPRASRRAAVATAVALLVAIAGFVTLSIRRATERPPVSAGTSAVREHPVMPPQTVVQPAPVAPALVPPAVAVAQPPPAQTPIVAPPSSVPPADAAIASAGPIGNPHSQVRRPPHTVRRPPPGTGLVPVRITHY